jgi:hypothetical protein
MKAFDTLDATRLFGFASLGDRLVNGVDFKDDMLGARLGAKVGFPEHPQLDFSRLLGFASLGESSARKSAWGSGRYAITRPNPITVPTRGWPETSPSLV